MGMTESSNLLRNSQFVINDSRMLTMTATPADGPRLRGQRSLGHAIRVMREARGWSQAELVQRILMAEGVEPERALRTKNNMRVSRIETGKPITLRNLTGFALAFGYRNVIDWLADLFAPDAELNADEQAVLRGYRTATAEGRRLILVMAGALQAPAPRPQPGSAALRRRP